MTVKDFIENNKDILISPVTEAEFQQLTDGCVVFCITTNTGNKPVLDRAVRTAGYQMVVATTKGEKGNVVDISTVGLTIGGYAKIDFITANDINGNGTKVLYRCKPLAPKDKRRNHHWVY